MLAMLTLAGCTPVRAVRRVELLSTLFDVHDHVADFRNMKAYFPISTVQASGTPSELEQGDQILLPASFDFRGTPMDTAGFLASTDTTGLIVIKNDKIVFERYYLRASPPGRCPRALRRPWSASRSARARSRASMTR
jgi:hypothetical protein